MLKTQESPLSYAFFDSYGWDSEIVTFCHWTQITLLFVGPGPQFGWQCIEHHDGNRTKQMESRVHQVILSWYTVLRAKIKHSS